MNGDDGLNHIRAALAGHYPPGAGMTGFKCAAQRYGRISYRGRVTCYENGRRLWSEMSPITRLTRDDALDDARGMARDYTPTKAHARILNENPR